MVQANLISSFHFEGKIQDTVQHTLKMVVKTKNEGFQKKHIHGLAVSNSLEPIQPA